MLEAGARVCPGCQADLTPYLDLEALIERYLVLAREYLDRNKLDQAQVIADHLSQLTNQHPAEQAEIAARLAILKGDFQAVTALIPQLKPDVAEAVAALMQQRKAQLFKAHELYNHALSAARTGALPLAAEHTAQAVHHDPADASIWALKLKVDLKCGHWQRCYADLENLDRLGARPPEFYRLEELLPPLSS
ncbi:hypothetical protein JW859_04825 [bacterium]|nr:hypothetical protein [bacterium]